jgi:antimicrobial peptide system SdpA family protein
MDETSTSLLGGVGLILAITITCIALVVANLATPFNPTQTPSLVSEGINPLQVWMPQGFAFFTRNPREPEMRLYASNEGEWQSASLGPYSRSSNLFGLDRKPRAQLTEYALLLERAGVPTDKWASCEDAPVLCLKRVSVTDTLENTDPAPTLCGIVGFVRQDPVPWAWNESRDTIEMPSKVLKLRISC